MTTSYQFNLSLDVPHPRCPKRPGVPEAGTSGLLTSISPCRGFTLSHALLIAGMTFVCLRPPLLLLLLLMLLLLLLLPLLLTLDTLECTSL